MIEHSVIEQVFEIYHRRHDLIKSALFRVRVYCLRVGFNTKAAIRYLKSPIDSVSSLLSSTVKVER